MSHILIKITIYLLIFYPILGLISWTTINERPIPIYTLFVGFCFVVTLYEYKKILVPTYLKYYSIFCFYEIISKYIINKHIFSFDGNFKKTLFYFSSLIVLLLIENYHFNRKFINIATTFIKTLIILSAVVSIIQLFEPMFFINKSKTLISLDKYYNANIRLSSIFSWGDHGFDMGLGIPVLFSLILGLELKYGNRIKLETCAAAIVVLFSLTRYAMGGYLIALFQYPKYYKWYTWYKWLPALLIFLVVILFGIQKLGFDIDYLLHERLTDSSYQTRFQAVDAFVYAFPEAQIFGTGGVVSDSLLDFYRRKTRIHNGYLAIPYYYGIIGSAFYFLFLTYLFLYLFRVARRSNYWGSFYGLLIFLFANLTVDINHFMVPGLLIMMVYNKYFSDISEIVTSEVENLSVNEQVSRKSGINE